MPIADPHGFIAAICAAVGTLEFAVLLDGRGSHEDRWTRAAHVASLGSGAVGGSMPVEFSGFAAGFVAVADAVAEACTLGEAIAFPVAGALAVAADCDCI
jgi:hypothetical protein